MPTVKQSDNPNNSLTVAGLDSDEFVPKVSFEMSKVDQSDDKIKFSIDEKEDVPLSEYLDRGHRNNQTIIVETSENKISLPFEIKKGNTDSDDDDGVINVRLSEKIKGVSILSELEFKSKYDSKYSLDLEFKGMKEPKDFYVDFFAKDDDDDDWVLDTWLGSYTINDNTGKLDNIFCGRIKIKYKKPCICKDDDWPNVIKMVSESEKVQYGRTPITWTNDSPECYHYALQQLRNLGYWVKTERWNKKWDGTKELNDDIFQLHIDEEVAGMKKGPQKEMFKKSLIYLKDAMSSKTPVMVGLDYHSGYANDDLITDHFAVITGCGRDVNGKLYFDVTDNAFQYQKYYCNCDNHEIRSADSIKIITQVRESRKL